jgi:ketosteroid isomerase-like protein
MRIFFVLAMLLSTSLVLVSCANEGTNTASKPTNAVNNAAGNAAPAPAAVEAEVRKLATDAAAAIAKNDVAALDKLYADNYMLVNLDGSVQNKAERLASFKSGETKFESFAYDEISVRSNPEGTGAVVIARATAKGMNKGKPVESLVRVTQVWTKTKDGWRQASGHATSIAASSASAADSTPAASNTTPANK